jgi:hypothetical protein
MDRRVDAPTTRIVGRIQGRDQREEHDTKAAMGGLGPKVQERWTSESVDPPRRISFPESRTRNVPHRSWRDVADGPLSPERVEVKNAERMTAIVKDVATWLGADLVGVADLDPAFVFTHHGLRIDDHEGRAGQPVALDHQHAISLAVEMEPENFRNSPSFIDGAAVGKAYMEASKLAVHVAAWIREWWRRASVWVDDRRRGKKPNPAQERLYDKVPGDRSTWTIPKVIE